MFNWYFFGHLRIIAKIITKGELITMITRKHSILNFIVVLLLNFIVNVHLVGNVCLTALQVKNLIV